MNVVRLIQAHTCVQNFAGQAQICVIADIVSFFSRKEKNSHFKKQMASKSHFTFSDPIECWGSSGSVTVCVFITAVSIIKLCAWGEGDSGGLVLRETTSRGALMNAGEREIV